MHPAGERRSCAAHRVSRRQSEGRDLAARRHDHAARAGEGAGGELQPEEAAPVVLAGEREARDRLAVEAEARIVFRAPTRMTPAWPASAARASATCIRPLPTPLP